MLAVLGGRRFHCVARTGKSTLNRLELTAAGAARSRQRAVMANFVKLDQLLVELFLEAHPGRRANWGPTPLAGSVGAQNGVL